MSRLRGMNCVFLAGNVGKVVIDKTNNGRPAGSFWLAIEDKTKLVTWVRANVYDGLADLCEKKLFEGSYAMVRGGLMNRTSKQTNDRILEIRVNELVIIDSEGEDEYGQEEDVE